MSNSQAFIPHLTVSNCAAAIDFYKAAFGAEEVTRHAAPNTDKIMHATLKVNGGVLMMNDDFSERMGGKPHTAEALGGSSVAFHLQVENADAAWERAILAGAKIKMPLADQFWGARYGQLLDPFGQTWSIGQTISQPSKEEVEEAAKAIFTR